jgi:hypothetical protein
LLRYNKDDDDQSLRELVRQERFGAGAGDQKNMDAELASAITRDAKFDVSVLLILVEAMSALIEFGLG